MSPSPSYHFQISLFGRFLRAPLRFYRMTKELNPSPQFQPIKNCSVVLNIPGKFILEIPIRTRQIKMNSNFRPHSKNLKLKTKKIFKCKFFIDFLKFFQFYFFIYSKNMRRQPKIVLNFMFN